jgi:MFS family permease
LILLAGQLLTIVKAKWVLLVAFFFFELGSLIAGVAKSMTVLIVGRAIQGVGELHGLKAPKFSTQGPTDISGTSGMFSSMMLIIVNITRVEQRPAFLASFG